MGRLIDGWHTNDRVEAFNLAHGIDLLEREYRNNGSNLPPNLMRARVEMRLFARRGSGLAPFGTDHDASASRNTNSGTQEVPQNGQSPILGVKATAERLGVSAELVRRRCRQGKLPAVRLGKQWQIDSKALEAILLEKASDKCPTP